ncbi:hypothetical protein BDZ94DRAFT_1258643, partial [Collybia nuda]
MAFNRLEEFWKNNMCGSATEAYGDHPELIVRLISFGCLHQGRSRIAIEGSDDLSGFLKGYQIWLWWEKVLKTI